MPFYCGGGGAFVRLVAFVISVCFTSITFANPNPDYEGSLWVGGEYTLTRHQLSTLAPNLTLSNTSNTIQATATDTKLGHYWAVSLTDISVYDFTGQLLSNTQYSSTGPWGPLNRRTIILDPATSAAWIGTGYHLYKYTAPGVLSQTYAGDEIKSLAIDSVHNALWVAFDTKLEIRDLTSGNVTATVTPGPCLGVEDAVFDPALDEVWVLNCGVLKRYDRAGQNTFTSSLTGLKHLALSQNSVWVSNQWDMYRVGSTDTILAQLQPIQTVYGIGVLLGDDKDGAAWVAGEYNVVRVDITGAITNQVATSFGINSLAVYRDAGIPKISFTSPVDGAFINTMQPSLLLDMIDAGNGVDTTTHSVKVNGTAATVACTYNLPLADCSLNVPLTEGLNTLSTLVSDFNGNQSAEVSINVTVDTNAPQLTLTSPANNTFTNQAAQNIVGAVNETATVTMNGQTVTVTNNNLSHAVTLTEGLNVFSATATDAAGNASTTNLNITLDTIPPVDPDMQLITVTDLGNGQVQIDGAIGSVEGGATLQITNTRTGQVYTVIANADGSFSLVTAGQPGDSFSIAVVDKASNTSGSGLVSLPNSTPGGGLPPDPSTVATPIDTTVTTTIFDSTAFLYTGTNPIQTGVLSGTIDPKRSAVIRGRVLHKDNSPLSGVTITVHNHPEFGQTLSRADGRFDMVVNGGGDLTVNYIKQGYLPVQRTVNTPWQKYSFVNDVVMVSLDNQVTTITVNNSTPQIAQGSVVVDSDGTRQVTLMFPSNTQTSMTLPDGTTQSLTTMNVRATEYTVGANGPQSMPGELPDNIAYTFAVELSVDEAIAVNASSVSFSQPVSLYVDNFMNAPVGMIVPYGYYNHSLAKWLPMDNGLVIKMVGVDGAGMALLDITGDDLSDSATSLLAIGIKIEERIQIANVFSSGKIFWRIPVDHFSPGDANLAPMAPGDAINPTGLSATGNYIEKDSDQKCGSIIECQNQVLGEVINITGTDHNIDYRSNRVEGYKAAYTLDIPLSDSRALPPSLKRIDLDIVIAGQKTSRTFAPSADLKTTFTWDGKDVYGRKVIGRQKASVNIGYVYDAVYAPRTSAVGRAFGLAGVSPSTFRRDNLEYTLWNRYDKTLGSNISKYANLGNLTLDIHHHYSVNSGEIYFGNGITQSEAATFNIIKRIAGLDVYSTYDGKFSGKATDVQLESPQGVDVGPDGSLYIANFGKQSIHKVDTSGNLTTLASMFGYSTYFMDVAVAGDGSIYTVVLDYTNYSQNKIYKVHPDGTLERIAGGGTETQDGALAINSVINLGLVPKIDIGRDGSIYVCENNKIRRIMSDGRIYTVVGTGTRGFSGDGGPAIQAQIDAWGIAVTPDDSIYIADFRNARVRKVTPDGIITTIAGTGQFGFLGEGGPAISAMLRGPNDVVVDDNGIVYISDYNGNRLMRIDQNGILTRVSGDLSTGWFGNNGNNGNALLASHSITESIAIGKNGEVYVADWSMPMVRKISSPFPAFNNTDYLIASEDGTEAYRFNYAGKHLETINTISGVIKYQFIYDINGYLTQVIDGDSNTLTINRNSAGDPLSIVSPDGQVTTLQLDGNGNLAKVTNPASESYTLTFTQYGLLTQFQDPNQNTSVISYNPDGKLNRDTNAQGGSYTLGWQQYQNGYTSTLTSQLGRMLTYRVDVDTAGNRTLTNTETDGTTSSRVKNVNGNEVYTRADGTLTNVTFGPDPRFDMQSQFPQVTTVMLPSGKISTIQESRTTTLSNPDDKLSMQTETITSDINGSIYSTVYDAATRTYTETTPTSRTSSVTTDAQGRITQAKVPGLADANVAYDTRGRLSTLSMTDGVQARNLAYAYNPQGYLDTVTDALNRTVKYEYDAAGRVTKQTLPDNRVINYAYDKKGNVTSITPPGKSAHVFNYNKIDQEAGYTPPALGTTQTVTQYTYNLDKQLTQIARPDGKVIDVTYDNGGRRNQVILPRGTIGYAYNTAGQISTITDPDNGQLSYTYDGFLPLTETLTGQVNGSVVRTYDNNFRVTQLTVNSIPFSFGYDLDGNLTQAEQLTLSRDPANGFLTGTTLGGVTTTQGYNAFAEMTSFSANDGTSDVYQVSYTHDVLGRITQKVETIAGTTTTYDYGYDVAGRLTTVQQNGTTVSTYTYDSNGNRLNHNGTTGTYDAQDRLLTYGAASYSYTLNGELSSKTQAGVTTDYTYDTMGNITKVVLPGGTTIDYVIDGRNRRVGKKINGQLTQGFIYKDQLNPVAELDGQGSVVATFVYGSRVNVPDYMDKGGNTYRIISDHLGSPRLVINTQDGSIAQRMDYDEFGNIINDTNPGFQPFGFAGGIYDQHTGFTRFGARDYDAIIGRWVSKDPILFSGGDTNIYAYVANNPLNFIDPLGLELNTGGFVLNNPQVTSNLQALNQAIINQGLSNSDFQLTVTGGDRYRDAAGNIRSSTNNEIIPNSSPTSPHLIERGARACDLSVSGVQDDVFDRALRDTDFLPQNTIRDYDDGHTHIGLPNLPTYWYRP